MTNPHKLSECADMPEEQFQECLERVAMNAFMENPTQALIDAGVTLKNGVTLKFVETEAEANSLPEKVFPLMRPQRNNEELTMADLDKVAGARNKGGPSVIRVGSNEKGECLTCRTLNCPGAANGHQNSW